MSTRCNDVCVVCKGIAENRVCLQAGSMLYTACVCAPFEADGHKAEQCNAVADVCQARPMVRVQTALAVAVRGLVHMLAVECALDC